MGTAIITLRIMPEDPEQDLKRIEKEAQDMIGAWSHHTPEQMKVTISPIAFGLKAIDIMFPADEKLGGTEDLEKKLGEISGVQSCECADVRRALG